MNMVLMPKASICSPNAQTNISEESNFFSFPAISYHFCSLRTTYFSFVV